MFLINFEIIVLLDVFLYLKICKKKKFNGEYYKKCWCIGFFFFFNIDIKKKKKVFIYLMVVDRLVLLVILG